MNNVVDVHYLLGRQHIEERLREAEASRRFRAQPDGALPLRQQIGWTLVRVGMLLIGPHQARPLRGH
jgi:hypothetical protein